MRKGDYIIYSATGNVGTAKVEGIMAVKVVRIKDKEFLVDVLPKGVPFLKRARLKFPFNGDDLADLGGVLTGWSVLADGSRMGEEIMHTRFGERTMLHFQRLELRDGDSMQTEQFVDPVHHLPYAARISGHSGEVRFDLIRTNIDWIMEG